MTSTPGIITTYSYDNFNRIISTDNASGLTTYSYDTLQTQGLTTENTAGAVTMYTYDSQNRLSTTIDPLGHTTTYSPGFPRCEP